MELLGNKQIVSKAIQSMEPSQPGLVRVQALNVCQSLMVQMNPLSCHYAFFFHNIYDLY